MLNIPQWMRCRMLDWRAAGYSYDEIRRKVKVLIDQENERRASQGIRTLEVSF